MPLNKETEIETFYYKNTELFQVQIPFWNLLSTIKAALNKILVCLQRNLKFTLNFYLITWFKFN